MYLGNWLTESTADVYVREKRNVVVEIWGQVAQKVPNLNLGPGRERREDLNHGPAPATSSGHHGIEREGEASPLVPSGSAPSARSWSVVEHEPGDTRVKAKDLFPATPDLPLRVVAAVKRTGNAGQSRIHLLNVEGTAVGCGWRPAASKVQEDLEPRVMEDTDNDSVLMLRQMYLTSLAYKGLGQLTVPQVCTRWTRWSAARA